MITAIGPDGARHQFPDETPGDVIDGVMARTYGGGGQTGVASPPVAAAPPSPPPAAYLAAGGLGVKPGIGAEFGALNDIVRAAASGMTLGGADRIAAGLGSATGIGGTQGDYAGNLAAQRAQTAGFEQAHPYVAGAANLAGAGLGIAAAPEGLIAAPTTAAGRILGGAATGGTVGAIQGGLAAPDWTNAGQTGGSILSGAGAGAAAGGLAGLAGSVLGGSATPPALDLAGVKAAKDAAYAKADALGAAYTPEAYGKLVDSVISDAKNANINPALNPRATAAIEEMQNFRNKIDARGYPPSLTEVDQLRQFVNRNVSSANEPSERFFGNKITGNIDKFIANPGENAMAAGAAPEAAAAIQNARALNTRLAKGQALADALGSSDEPGTVALRTARTGTGGNIDNVTRQELSKLLQSGTNWTPEERSLLTKSVMGTPTQNMLRLAGKLSPTTGGLMGALELGAMGAGAPHVIPTAAAGWAAKSLADRMTRNNAQNLLQQVLSGGVPPTTALQVNPQARQLGAALAGAGASRIAAQPQY